MTRRRATTDFGRCVAAVFLFVLYSRFAVADEPVKLVMTRHGFKPDTVRAQKGDTIRLRIEADDEEHCFALDELRVEKRVRPGRPVVVELTPDRAGTFTFHCCLEPADSTPRGRLVVSD